MAEMLIRVSERMKQIVQMVATVDEVSQTQVVREALKEYFGTLDLESYGKDLGKLKKAEEAIDELEGEPEVKEQSKGEETKICGKCDATNRENSKFCVHCGAKFDEGPQ